MSFNAGLYIGFVLGIVFILGIEFYQGTFGSEDQGDDEDQDLIG